MSGGRDGWVCMALDEFVWQMNALRKYCGGVACACYCHSHVRISL